jgi:N4-gp56 family major capsid protein
MKNIIKPLGSAGSADPLDQRQTSGWKATHAVTRLNEAFAVRIEHAVSA